MHDFTATIAIIGVNPYVSVPQDILAALLAQAGRQNGPIPVHGRINDTPYTQTLVRYAGAWRLYINTLMLKDSPKRIGEVIHISIDFDPRDRSLPLHTALHEALQNDAVAQRVFDSLSPSRQHEINRYISALKSDAKIHQNVQRAIAFLHGKGRFVGREL
jgi:hypothetical protein